MEIVSAADLASGSSVFTDRDFKFTSVGNYPDTCVFVRVANDDQNTTATSVQTTLEVQFDSTVYLDFWRGSDSLANVSSWFANSNWRVDPHITPTKFTASSTKEGPGIVIKRNFGAGTIKLMGNNGNGRGTYYAFVCSRGKSVPNNIHYA